MHVPSKFIYYSDQLFLWEIYRLIRSYHVLSLGSEAGREGERSGKSGRFVPGADRQDAGKGKMIHPIFHILSITSLHMNNITCVDHLLLLLYRQLNSLKSQLKITGKA